MSGLSKDLDRRIQEVAGELDQRKFYEHGVAPGVRIVTGAGGGGGVTDHGALTGLGDDAPPQYLRTDGTRALTGNQDAGGNRITNLADPSVATDAATKAYVDANSGVASFNTALLSFWSGRTSYTESTTSFAWKGQRFTPFRDIDLYAIAWWGLVVVNATYQAAVATESGGNIATITKSNTLTMPGSLAGTNRIDTWLDFASPVRLTAHTTYYLLAGRTDGADTYAFPVSQSGATTHPYVPMPGFTGASTGMYPRIAKANPAVGDAIDLTQSGVPAMGYLFRLP
jgi:hypothetical protein